MTITLSGTHLHICKTCGHHWESEVVEHYCPICFSQGVIVELKKVGN